MVHVLRRFLQRGNAFDVYIDANAIEIRSNSSQPDCALRLTVLQHPFRRAGAATSVFLFSVLSKFWGLGTLLLAIAALQIVAAAVTARLAFEPARCSLEEIAAA